MTSTLTIQTPDDWHLHFRDGEMLQETVPATARCFKRAIVMPNLVPPVTTTQMALKYKERIMQAVPQGVDFEPLVTLFLTNDTMDQDIKEAKAAGIVASKLYPAGATTNSDDAVKGIKALYPVFEAMQEVGMLLLIHGEVTEAHIDIFDREKEFIDTYLRDIVNDFPNLKIVFEHITTKDAVDFVLAASDNVAATITPQHFLGTDSAPHEKHKKESACGCAGCYSAWSAIELYAQVFEDLGAIDKLEGFASHYGPDFYGLPRNEGTITLQKQDWEVPANISLPTGDDMVPFFAGETLNWKLA